MDPNEALSQLRRMCLNDPDDPICEVFGALDEWLSRGGFLPRAWADELPLAW